MRISAESANSFRNYVQRQGVSRDVSSSRAHADRQELPFELSVNVLTASYWPQPIVQATPCTFGSTLTAATGVYQKYYDSRHSGRRLTWQGSLGTADVRVWFKARSHDLNVSTQALVVLLLFEDVKEDETLSYSVSLALSSLTL